MKQYQNYIFDFNKSIKNLTIGTLKNMKLKDYKNYKLGHVNPNGFFPKLEVGSIKEIRFERSGLIMILNQLFVHSQTNQADAFLYFDLLFDEWDLNVADIQENGLKFMALIVCVGVKQIKGSSIGGLEIEGEDFEAKQFIMPKNQHQADASDNFKLLEFTNQCASISTNIFHKNSTAQIDSRS